MIIQKKRVETGHSFFFSKRYSSENSNSSLIHLGWLSKNCCQTIYSGLHFLCSKTLNSCRRKLVCAKIVLNVGKHLSRCTLLPIVECSFQFGHWRSFDLRLQIKIRNASLLIAFSATNGSKTSKIWRRKEFFTSVHTQGLYATPLYAFSQLGENSSVGHVFSPFSKTLRSLCFIFILEGCCKVQKATAARPAQRSVHDPIR